MRTSNEKSWYTRAQTETYTDEKHCIIYISCHVRAQRKALHIRMLLNGKYLMDTQIVEIYWYAYTKK